jgi:DNA-binding PadR family transcriptional regulator
MSQPPNSPNNPAEVLPLTPAVFQILLALTDGERHGYAIMQEVAHASAGTIRLGPGNLYRTLRSLAQQGLVEESEERPDPAEDDTRRRYYRLTAFGRRVAIAETQRLAQVVALARSKPLLGPAFSVDGGTPR